MLPGVCSSVWLCCESVTWCPIGNGLFCGGAVHSAPTATVGFELPPSLSVCVTSSGFYTFALQHVSHDSLVMPHLQWLLLLLVLHYRQSASVLQSTLWIWALFIFPFLKSAKVVSRSELRISVVANLCFSSKVKVKVMSNISVSLGNLRRENRNLWDQMTERIYCHKKKGQNDATISVTHCINNIYLIEQMQDETVWVEMSNIIMVYNTPNCLWQVTSVMYWAVNDGQIMPALIC